MPNYDGVSAKTKRGLVQSGAMTAEELGLQRPQPVGAIAQQPARGIGKQVSQAEYDAQLAAQKAKADANYAAYKARRGR